jgi:hypothetical protein
MNKAHLKLGRGPVKRDARTFKLSDYLTKLPPPPASLTYAQVVPQWGMMANDRYGDCTCAALAHQIQLWCATAKRPFAPTDADVLHAYADVTGFDPATGENDNGAVELDVLNYARRTGLAGHTIEAYVAVNHANTSHVKSSVHLFEGCYIGLDLPIAAQTDAIWKTGRGAAYAAGSWGGHAVNVVGYDAQHLTCVTWGATQRMTWGFFAKYCVEAYALLSMDMMSGGRCPAGFDVSALRNDLKAL